MRPLSAVRNAGWTALIICLPALLGLFLVLRYGVNVPIGDEWVLAPLFAHTFSGHLSIAELLAQHNEHRPLVPRVIFILMTAIGGWNTRIPMFGTLALTIAVAFGVASLARQTLGHEPRRYGIPLFLSALFLFSPTQWETFLMGFVLMMLIPPLCLVIAILSARTVRSTGRALAIIGVCCAIATYSVASGLMLWPITTAVAWRFHRPTSRRAMGQWAAFAAWAVAIIGLYFYGYERPPHHAPLTVALAQPFTVATEFCAFLGGALTYPMPRWSTAVLIGAGLNAVLAGGIVMVWRRRHDADLIDRAIVWIAPAAYAVMSGVLIAIGRTGMGRDQFTASRYVTLSLWAVIGAIMLGAVLVQRSDDQRGDGPGAGVFWMLAGSALTLYFLTLQPALQTSWEAWRVRLQLRTILSFSESATDDQMSRLFPDPSFARSGIEQARQVGLLPRQPLPVTWTLATPACEHGAVDTFANESPDRARAAGWAYLREARRPADAVLLTVDRADGPTVVALSFDTGAREDVVKALADPRAVFTGWGDTFALPADRHRLAFWAFDAVHRTAYPLCPGAGAASIETARGN